MLERVHSKWNRSRGVSALDISVSALWRMVWRMVETLLDYLGGDRPDADQSASRCPSRNDGYYFFFGAHGLHHFFAAQGFLAAQGFFAAQGFLAAQGFFAAHAFRELFVAQNSPAQGCQDGNASPAFDGTAAGNMVKSRNCWIICRRSDLSRAAWQGRIGPRIRARAPF